MKNTKLITLTRAGVIAAVYVVITIILRPFSFGEIQLRVSEALTILPVFTESAIPGLFIGCLIANVIGGAALPDIIFGSLATFVAAILSRKLRSKGFVVAAIPPIIVNALVVPFILKYAYGIPLPIPFMMLTVGIGQVLSAGVLGVLLGRTLEKHAKFIFD